jgi:uncharacterized protein
MRLVASILAALVGVGLLAAPAAAQDDLRSTISVVGDGRVLVEPDVANVSLSVESTAPTLEAAQADASTRMQAVLDALVAQGIVREDIRTNRLGVNPIYDQRDNSVLRGYRAVNAVQVKVRDVAKVGPIVEAATAAGANRVDGISFAVDNLEPYKNQARAQALANARAKADQLAQLTGLRIVGIKTIAESDASATPVRAERTAAAPAPAAAPPPPVEPGQQEVRTQVSVTYIVQ